MSAQCPTTPLSFRLVTLTLLSGSALMLAACGTTENGPTANGSATSAALAQAADDAAGASASLPSLEKIYKRDTNNVNNAVRYSRGLREAGRLSRASIIMAPFAKDDRKPSSAAKTEFAAVQVALGNYDVAAENARKATAMDGKSWQAYDILGIALDAKGDHSGAEKALRKALELCPEEQQTPILNNLGLNLAAQGFLDEAAEVLRRALATSPDRSEVERNLRIVSALRESGGRAPSYLQNARDEAMKKEAAEKEKAKEKEKKSESAPSKKSDPVPAKKPAAKEPEKPAEAVPVPVQKPHFN